MLILLIVAGRLRRAPDGPPSPALPADTSRPVARTTPPPPAAQPPPGPVLVEPAGTPVLDLLVRLEAYRRVVRAGRAVYLDSLLAESDSMLRRWPDRPGDPVRIAVVRDSVSAEVSDAAELAQQAFARWQEHAHGVRFQVTTDTSAAEIVVRWVEELDTEVPRTGETHLVTRRDGAILRADIAVARRDPNGRLLDRDATLRTLVHEAGHALGLGHSDDDRDVMYPRPQSAVLSERDRRTVDLIYGLPPGSVKGGS